ncbi:hypothetical protein Tco_0089334 [Tanacetum coccineum]
MHSKLPLREVSFLDLKGLVHMMILMIMKRNDMMLMSVQPTLYFKDYPKISTSSSITTLKQKQYGTMSKCFWQVLSSPKKIGNLSCMMNLSGSRCFQDRFFIAVKLNKGLKETNHEQLYAYLKQHEKHAAQDRLIIERITPSTNDPLAFISSVQPYSQPSQSQSHQYQSSTTPPQPQNVQSIPYSQFAESSSLDSRYIQTKEIFNTLSKEFALLTQSFRATLPQTNNQL